jgi:hypothetical protein
MRWFRSNRRLGSRLALFALAIQFLLSFGHFHGSAQAAPALHRNARLAAAHLHALSLQEEASCAVGLRTSSGHKPDGQPTDDCAICAVMALANAMVGATPPCVAAPQVAGPLYLSAYAGFVDPNVLRVAFQSRAPPGS